MFIGAIGVGALQLLKSIKSQLDPEGVGTYNALTPQNEKLAISIFHHPSGGVNDIGIAIEQSGEVTSSLVNLKSGEVKSPVKLDSATGAVLDSKGQEKELINNVESKLNGLARANLERIAGLPSPPQHQ